MASSRASGVVSPAQTQLQETVPFLDDLTPTQKEAVVHQGCPLLIVAGAGTGKTTVITRRIAWFLTAKQANPKSILALTFTDKAAAEMEERVDLLVPYGYVDMTIKTFHAFGDSLIRDSSIKLGLSAYFRVLSRAEQLVFLKENVFKLPIEELRPLQDPAKFLDALLTVMARAKDEAVSPKEFLAYAQSLKPDPGLNADELLRLKAKRSLEIAQAYEKYQQLMAKSDAIDFGDQVMLAIRLLEEHPEVAFQIRQRFEHILVDEFQDTNYAQFRLLQLLAGKQTQLTVVADDDQSIYKWRGAAISNVIKFLDVYPAVRTIVLKENFRSCQPILNAAYRLIRFNNPDRLEVRQGIDKQLISMKGAEGLEPQFHAFDTVSSEADWVAKTIREKVAAGTRRPSDFAVLVRSNREADPFLRALNVAGVAWTFSGSSGLFAREESKLLLSCLKTLADPDDSLSWYHVASSMLYECPMKDLTRLFSQTLRTNRSLRQLIEGLDVDPALQEELSPEGIKSLKLLAFDVNRLLELSRVQSGGQVLYRWLLDRQYLAALSQTERIENMLQLQTVARFFEQLRRLEELTGPKLPELISHLELFQAMGNEPVREDDVWADRVSVLTFHKAKGLEFPVVFMVGLVHGRFPTPQRKDALELPEALIKDILPQGDYHQQEERRLFYVGMTRAKEELHLSCAYDYGGKTTRKVSQFVLESLDLPTPSPAAKASTAKELLERSAIKTPLPVKAASRHRQAALRLDAHGMDDYLTCPLKYRYSHIVRIPVMRHHLVVYGSALHGAIEQFFQSRLKGAEMGLAALLAAFKQGWSSEGFLTREHEQLRLSQGQDTLKRFYEQQQKSPEHPTLIEEKFKFGLKDLLIVGRWDRVDCAGSEAVIIDYKSSDIRDQETADKRTRESMQLLVYALAWQTLHGKLPLRVELRFLESGLTGTAKFDEEDMDKAKELLQKAARGIRQGEFKATPQEYACRWCAFQAICPFAFQTP